jgi:hypothetical protein
MYRSTVVHETDEEYYPQRYSQSHVSLENSDQAKKLLFECTYSKPTKETVSIHLNLPSIRPL